MTTKLNLTIEEKTVIRVKRYAERENTSVSRLVDNLLTQWLDARETKKEKSFVEKYAGIINSHSTLNLEKEKEEYLNKKYDY
jgi:hypothetical protein